ncbi:MAG: MlaD family protein [Aeromicrobium sp.]|uniref:MCE family protein n=1 Tax=Aeromicrobium sp. TaxID=1871063 RepID=UPI0025B920CE|nr:MlaD family protein [Aeromicrobium sp.]MCK5892425.1 MCE family protein [Aeromicrobium sp.]MDF1704070.1 MlaD family protein [Aeromicrobium sp.]
MNWGVRIKFSIFAVVALAIMLVIYNTMVNRVGGESTRYTAEFTSVSGLRPGDDVRAAGVRVGRVEQIRLEGTDRARVEFTLGAGQTVSDTTQISVRYQNLLGQRYLSLIPGEEPGTPMAAGDVLGTDQTDPGFDLTALLNGFEPLFETLEPEALNRLATSIVAVLQGEGGTVEALLAETARLTQDLAAKDDVIGDVLTNLTPVLESFTAQEAQFTTTVDALSDLMTGLAAERDVITGSFDGVSELAQAAASLTQEIRPDVDTAIGSLRAVADTLVGHQAALDELFASAPLGFDSFTRPTNTGTWLNMYICVITLDVLPGSSISLGNPAGPYSEVCS